MNHQNLATKLLGFLGWAFQNCIGHTVRLKVIGAAKFQKLREKGKGVILVTWHGRTFLCIYYFRKQGLYSIVSLSKDGEIQNSILSRFGWRTIRGSTYRRSVGALIDTTRKLRQGAVLGFTPDGPRGPNHKVQPGTVFLARASGAPIIPVGASAYPRFLLVKAWDEYLIPQPFSRGVLVFGEPIWVPKNAKDDEINRLAQKIEQAISEVMEQADKMVMEKREGLPIAYLLYNLLLVLLLPFVVPFYLFQVRIKGKTFQGWKQRLGLYPQRRKAVANSRPIWVHAVSVGEVMAASSIISALKESNPNIPIVVSTITDTGNFMAHKILKGVDEIIYFPLDLPFVIKRALKWVNPGLFVMVETELWPNFLHLAKRYGVRTLLVNGRISNDTFERYKYVAPILKWAMDGVECFAMQSQEDANRIIEMGAPASKVEVFGNSKFDQVVLKLGEQEKHKLLVELQLSTQAKILVAGSTHAGEEEIVLDAFQQVRKKYPQLILILAPRHPERVPNVERLVVQAGWDCVRRTQCRGGDRQVADVIIIDTIGELWKIYGIATLVFVGGSLVPIGGHNILEAGAQGKPVLFGPYMHNFKESAHIFITSGAGIQVQDGKELVVKVLELLANPTKLADIGKKAHAIIEAHQGASKRYAQLIIKLTEAAT